MKIKKIINKDEYIKGKDLINIGGLYDAPSDYSNNCELHTTIMTDITGIGSDYGIVMGYYPNLDDDGLEPMLEKIFYKNGWKMLWAYHTWNEDDNSIYDSYRQYRVCGYDTDTKAMVVEMGHHNLRTEKGTAMFEKALKRVYLKTRAQGCNLLYIKGIALGICENGYWGQMSEAHWQENMDLVEEAYYKR